MYSVLPHSVVLTVREACDHKRCRYSFKDANQREFVSVSVQAFFQGDTDPAIPCPGSASWIRLRHSCGYLEHGLPGRTGDNAVCAREITDTNRLGQRVLSTHLYPLHGEQDFLAEKQ